MTSLPEMLSSDQASHSDAADPLHLEFDAKDSEALVKMTGTMKWFDATRGLGFLVSDKAKGDILVHFSVLKEHDRRSLTEGDIVECLVAAQERGLQARKILSIYHSNEIAPDTCPPRS